MVGNSACLLMSGTLSPCAPGWTGRLIRAADMPSTARHPTKLKAAEKINAVSKP